MEGGAESVAPPSGNEKTNEKRPDEWIADWLDELCPFYMTLGVDYDDFWHGDYTRLKYYVDAHYLNIERRNQEMWMQGAYNEKALEVVIHNAVAKRGTQPAKYPDKPIRITPITEREKQLEEQKSMQAMKRVAENWADKWNAKFGKAGETDGTND